MTSTASHSVEVNIPSLNVEVLVWLQCLLASLMLIGVDLAGILGGGRGARRAPMVGLCQVEWGIGRGVPSLPSWLTGLWGESWVPQWGPGRSAGRKRIWAYFEGHRMLLFVPMTKSGGQFALASLTSNSEGLVPPWSTPMLVLHIYQINYTYVTRSSHHLHIPMTQLLVTWYNVTTTGRQHGRLLIRATFCVGTFWGLITFTLNGIMK